MKKLSGRKTAKTLILMIGSFYLGICLFMWAAQRTLLYHPVTEIQPPHAYGLQDFTDVHLEDADGTQVHAWYHEARRGYPTLVHFHGNGGNLSNRMHYFLALADAGFGLLALDYRGYGASAGTPSEQGFYQDARVSIGYATQTLHLPPNRLVLYGESIGTGVAVQMGTEFPAAAIVLQSPYISVEAVAVERYSWLPVHLLLEDTFDSASKIAHVHAPLLLFHGEKDVIIPIADGKALFAQANEPKEAVYFPLEGHNDLSIAKRVQSLLDFCRKYNLIAQ